MGPERPGGGQCDNVSIFGDAIKLLKKLPAKNIAPHPLLRKNPFPWFKLLHFWRYQPPPTASDTKDVTVSRVTLFRDTWLARG